APTPAKARRLATWSLESEFEPALPTESIRLPNAASFAAEASAPSTETSPRSTAAVVIPTPPGRASVQLRMRGAKEVDEAALPERSVSDGDPPSAAVSLREYVHGLSFDGGALVGRPLVDDLLGQLERSAHSGAVDR